MLKWVLQGLQVAGLNLFYLVGSFIGFGFLFNVLEHWNNSLIMKTFGKWGIMLTGFIGTVVHEASHALMCLIFRHKIQEVKWFRPIAGQTDGVLGYVTHTYDKQSKYQTIGNFFIGIAPIIGGTLVMLLLFRGLMPEAYQACKQGLSIQRYTELALNGKFTELIGQGLSDVGFVLRTIITHSQVWTWKGLIFISSVYSISTHMGLSPADLKGSWSGLLALFGLVLLLTFVASLIGLKVGSMMPVIVTYNVYISLFLMMGLFFSLVTIGVSWIFSLILA